MRKQVKLLIASVAMMSAMGCGGGANGGTNPEVSAGGAQGDTNPEISAGIGVIGNGLRAQDRATLLYDVTQDAFINVEPSGFTATEIEGTRTGNAEVTSLTATVADAQKFLFLFNNFSMRQGYPAVTGSVATNFVFTNTSIKGQLTGENVVIGESQPMRVDLTYNLVFERGFWRGTMRGTIVEGDRSFIIDHNYDAPILTSVALSTKHIENGGEVALIVTVNSNSPVTFLSANLQSPVNVIFGGGNGRRFEQISKGVWQYTEPYLVSAFAPSGTYVYSGVKVQNEAQLESLIWPDLTFEVHNTQTADKPVINSAKLSSQEIINGGNITLTLEITSAAPPEFLEGYLIQDQSFFVTGFSQSIRAESGTLKDTWVYRLTLPLSEWLASGTYSFSEVRVKNAGQQLSEILAPISFTLTNEKVAEKPVITEVQLVDDANRVLTGNIPLGTNVGIQVMVTSNAPPYMLQSTLESPFGIIFGGGTSSFETVDLGNGQWRVTSMYHALTENSPQGAYVWSMIAITNEGLKISDLANSVNFTVVAP